VTISVHRAALLAALAVTAWIAGIAHAGESIGVLNDTGLGRCYASNFAEVPCEEATTGDGSALPRQDARYGRDAAAATGRLSKIGGGEYGFDFTRLCMSGEAEGAGSCRPSPPKPEDVENPLPTDWACVRDNVTGLTWALGNLARVNWDEVSSTDEGSFIGHANATARCGLESGWRLPTRREGATLLHFERKYPAIDPTYFPVLSYVQGDGGSPCYWTSDVRAENPIMNHQICFDVAVQGSYQCRHQVPGTLCDGPLDMWRGRVLLVNGEWRAPVAPEEGRDRFEVRAEQGVVEDNGTGLVWDRCSWGQTGDECEGDGTIFQAWADGMQVARIANELRYKGYYDWRIPNPRELETLVKTDAFDPSIDTEAFPNTPSNRYWTSASTWLVEPGAASWAFIVNFDQGAVVTMRKVPSPVTPTPDRCRIRLVRGGDGLTAFDGISERLLMADFEGAPPQ
jgi:hypothetical protein